MDLVIRSLASGTKRQSLSAATRVSYSSLHFSINYCTNNNNLITNMYIEAVGISVGMHPGSLGISVCKTVDCT